MADRWVPEYVVTKAKYESLERVITFQYNSEIHPTEADYKVAMDALFLGNANTSIADYVWLPLNLDGEYPTIEWKEEWRPYMEEEIVEYLAKQQEKAGRYPRLFSARTK